MSVMFPIVYEDHKVECELLRKISAQNILCVTSGGCTAFTLKYHYPNLSIDLVDSNSSQLELVKNKAQILNQKIKKNNEKFRKYGNSGR